MKPSWTPIVMPQEHGDGEQPGAQVDAAPMRCDRAREVRFASFQCGHDLRLPPHPDTEQYQLLAIVPPSIYRRCRLPEMAKKQLRVIVCLRDLRAPRERRPAAGWQSRGDDDGPISQTAGRQLDAALSAAGNRAGVLRGLDQPRVLRDRTQSGVQARMAECRPRRTASAQGQLLHQGTEGRQHLDHRGADRQRRGQGVSQHLQAPRQQAGVERHAAGGDQRRLPAVHLQVPRLALRPRRQPDLRAAGGGVLRPRQEPLRPGGRALRRLGRLHLRQLRRRNRSRRCATSSGR